MNEFLRRPGLFVLLITSRTCGPCKNFKPVFEKVSKQFSNVCFEMYDGVDDEKEIIAELKVIETPTVLFFKDCDEVYRQAGAMSENQFKELVTKYAI